MDNNENKKIHELDSVLMSKLKYNLHQAATDNVGSNLINSCRYIGEQIGLEGGSWKKALLESKDHLNKVFPSEKFTPKHHDATLEGFKSGGDAYRLDRKNISYDLELLVNKNYANGNLVAAPIPEQNTNVGFWKGLFVGVGVSIGVFVIYKSLNSSPEMKKIAHRKLTENVIDGGLDVVKKKLLK